RRITAVGATPSGPLVRQTAGYGATLSFPRVPAKVPSPSDLPTLDGCARRLESISQGRGRQDRIAEPTVRIQFPPAGSPSLTGSSAPRPRTPPFRGGVRAMGGGVVGRDRNRSATSRLPATTSLLGQIPVPQCQ